MSEVEDQKLMNYFVLLYPFQKFVDAEVMIWNYWYEFLTPLWKFGKASNLSTMAGLI